MKFLRLAGPFLFFALTVSPQITKTTGGAGGDPVIRIDVNLREVDLIVTDSKGNHVSDLQAEDFQLLEDGKPQRITNFSWVEVTPPPSGARLAALNEKPSLFERFSGIARFRKTPGNDILSAPTPNLRKEEIRRVIAIVADGGLRAPDDIVSKMDRIRKFVDEQIGPGDMVSIRSTLRSVVPMRDGRTVQIRDSSGIFRQFTNDRRQLDAATERLPRVCLSRVCIPDAPGALMAAIRDLQDLPGRKALLFMGRYRGPVDSIVSLANRAGVVIYVLDSDGFEPLEESAATKAARQLAEKTGGRRILSTVGFGLTASLNEVIEDLSGYYLLGYHTSEDLSDSALKTPNRHRVEVKVLRAGLSVRARDGRMGAPNPIVRQEANSAAQPTGREEILTKALFSAFTQDGVRVRLNPLFAASSPNEKKKRIPLVRTILDIDGRDVVFTDSDGRMKAVLDVVLAVFNEDGSQAGATNKSLTLDVSREKAAELAKAGLQYRFGIALSRPGPYQVRAAVRDAISGEIGSAYAFLDVPDFNQSRISLSSLVLSLPQGAPAAPDARAGWNEFAPGATLQYVCEVFGLKTPGKPPLPPSVETGVKFYRGGVPVAEIPPSPVNLEGFGGQLFLTGSMRIPYDLAAGNYMVELLAYDRLERSQKKQTAKQWIDLAVVGRSSSTNMR